MTTNDALLDRLKAIECRDATFPAREPALVFSRAEGSLVWDVEGKEYIDLCAGFGALALGHNPVELAGVHERRIPGAQQGMHCGITHGMGDVYASVAKVELLELMRQVLPPHLTRIALSLSGGQAVETAVKTAILATKRTGFIAFDGAYHGVDLGILPLTSRPAFRAPFRGWCPEDAVRRLPYSCERAELEQAIASLTASGQGCAAVIVEPIQGRAGVRFASPSPQSWLGMLREVCSEYGVLLIFDEVFVGLGRAGRLSFAREVPADLICLGKALGGGFPLSACVGTEAVMGAWPESTGEALHTGTFFGHPFSCEIALACLRTLVDQRLPARARKLGQRGLLSLQAFADRHPRHVREARGEGLMMALEFYEDGFGARLMDKLRTRGVIALVSGDRGEVLSITPPLNISETHFDTALARIFETAQDLFMAAS